MLDLQISTLHITLCIRSGLGEDHPEGVEDENKQHQGPDERSHSADDAEHQGSQGTHISSENHVKTVHM